MQKARRRQACHLRAFVNTGNYELLITNYSYFDFGQRKPRRPAAHAHVAGVGGTEGQIYRAALREHFAVGRAGAIAAGAVDRGPRRAVGADVDAEQGRVLVAVTVGAE